MSECDVRDVAEAHIQALRLPADKVSGKRFILHNETRWMMDMGKILASAVNPKHPHKFISAPYLVLVFVSLFDSTVKSIVSSVDKFHEFDNTLSKEPLEIKYTDFDTTMKDTAYSLIYHGLIPKPHDFSYPVENWTPLGSDKN